MRITSVDVFKIKGNTGWNYVICRVNTDEGISGFGEVGVSFGTGNTGSFGMLTDVAKLIIGLDPMKIELIWETIFRQAYWTTAGGALEIGAMSGLDIALWDIKGKAYNVPVYELLGGKTRDRLRAYASQIMFDWEPKVSIPLTRTEDYAKAAKKAVAEGFDCVKVDPIMIDPKGRIMGMDADWQTRGLMKNDVLSIAVERMCAVRDAVGPKVDIICELHGLTDTNTAIQLGREIDGLKCLYMEEPTIPLNVESTVEIARNVKTPLAGGERIFTRWGYREFLEKRALRVLQPDLGTVGGLTEGKKVADMANIYDVFIQYHTCGSPIALAAALQLEAVIPNFLIHEHLGRYGYNDTIAVCKHNYQPKDGYFEIPDLPGIGQELAKETMENADLKVTVK
jgi:galactonate dehydratase